MPPLCDRAEQAECQTQTFLQCSTESGTRSNSLHLQCRFKGSKVNLLCYMQDHVKQARTTQVETTKVLTDLLQASDTAAAAKRHIDAINEEFFMVSSTYLDMVSPAALCHTLQAEYSCTRMWKSTSLSSVLQQAKKEGNPEVCRKLEEVLRIAMEEKQKTLRPEIQLLNNLMAATTVPERERVCHMCRLFPAMATIFSTLQPKCWKRLARCAGSESGQSTRNTDHEQWILLWSA